MYLFEPVPILAQIKLVLIRMGLEHLCYRITKMENLRLDINHMHFLKIGTNKNGTLHPTNMHKFHQILTRVVKYQ